MCFHEAAHAVARCYVGSPVTPVEVFANGAGVSYGLKTPWSDFGGPWEHLTLVLAGPYAESRISKCSLASILLTSGASDYAMAKATVDWLVRHWAVGKEDAWARAEREVKQFLRHEWPSVAAVALALQGKRYLDAEEVEALIDASPSRYL